MARSDRSNQPPTPPVPSTPMPERVPTPSAAPPSAAATPAPAPHGPPPHVATPQPPARGPYETPESELRSDPMIPVDRERARPVEEPYSRYADATTGVRPYSPGRAEPGEPSKVRLFSKAASEYAIPLPEDLIGELGGSQDFLNLRPGENLVDSNIARRLASPEQCEAWGIRPHETPRDQPPYAGHRAFLSAVQRGIVVPLRGGDRTPERPAAMPRGGPASPPTVEGTPWTGASSKEALVEAARSRNLPIEITGHVLTRGQLLELVEAYDAGGMRGAESVLEAIRSGGNPPD